jgi:hypothetical protein
MHEHRKFVAWIFRPTPHEKRQKFTVPLMRSRYDPITRIKVLTAVNGHNCDG